MDIKVGLPKPEDTCGARNIKHFLRQMELCVHHLQKAVEEMEKAGEISKETYIIYRFPGVDLQGRESDNEGYVKVHVDEETDQMQNIEIEIATV